jgi:mRNA-degrading endonuclease toxin of MazEF toxin-antitoxin module
MASIRWIDLNKYSLVLIEFGHHKTKFKEDIEETYRFGLNLGSEFCYQHMAIVVSTEVKADEIAVVPLTTYSEGDENYPSNIIIDVDKYGHMVEHKTTIKTNHIRSIDKKKRIRKIIKPFISKTLQLKIEETLKKSIG